MHQKPSVGLITYQYPHLKTEQVLLRLLPKPFEWHVYALPFVPRPLRSVRFAHRPDMSLGQHPEVLAKTHRIGYTPCASDREIGQGHELYMVLGAGLLSSDCLAGKRILNSHPGVIPATRGLDAFKWAVLNGEPIGNTLHFIDAEVDAGEIVAVVPTPVYPTDTLVSLARRHYEMEISLMADFDHYLAHPSNSFAGIPAGEPHRRMPSDREDELLQGAPDLVARLAERAGYRH